jgi:integrase/recombinase XerD
VQVPSGLVIKFQAGGTANRSGSIVMKSRGFAVATGQPTCGLLPSTNKQMLFRFVASRRASHRRTADDARSCRAWCEGLGLLTQRAHCRRMRQFTISISSTSDEPVDHVRSAAAAYLGRFKGSSREHTESDLRCYLAWCADRGMDPLAARRPDLELYIRWMQELRRFKPSTVSRRFSVAAGFYRTCVIDGVLEHSPAEHVRRPSVPPESPTLGFTHLQFEAMLTAARESANQYDFALVAMLGLLGLRIFEATGADIDDLGEEHGHRVLRVCGKGGKVVLVPLPPAVGRAIDRAIADRASGPILLNSRGARMDRHAATRRLRHLAQHAGVRITRPHPHMLRHTFVYQFRCRSRPTRCPDRRPACRSPHHHAL